MHAIRQFLRKYDFPIHLVSITRTISFRVFRLWYTTLAHLKLSIIGGRSGQRLAIDGPLIMRTPRAGRIILGSGVSICSRVSSNLVGLTGPSIFEVIGDGRITIGDNVGMSSPIISSKAEVRIGSHAKLGGNVRIYDHDFHSLNWEFRRSFATDLDNAASSPVSIGEDVFVGTNTIILKGVVIGDRAVVGAGSVVAKDIPADEIWGGNPARFIKRNR